MYNDDLLITIKQNYNLDLDNDYMRIKKMKGYPHVFSIDSKNNSYIAKLINLSKIYYKDINKFYSDINNNDYILIPKKTEDNKYSAKYDDMAILIYDKLSNYDEKPDYLWWSNCLGSIHLSRINNNYLISYRKDIYSETLDILKKAYVYMDSDIKDKVNMIFSKINPDILNVDDDYVLCHNDPYDLNVLAYNNSYKIIDTDGMGLSKREYDIQRLLYNYAINCRTPLEVTNFFNNFKKTYEEETQKKINLELLKNLYYCDLIRSIAWLYIVSNDNTRDDAARQKKQLLLYKKSITNNIHEDFISQI